MRDTILQTQGLTKEFKGFTAVNSVDLEVQRGHIHALIGPNGAGKTTFFNLLTKFLPPTRGPASVRRALALVAGEKIDEPLDRDGRLKHLRSEKAIIEKALADLNSLMEEIKGEQSRLVAEQLVPEYRKIQRHIYDLAAALTAAVEAERQFYVAPIQAGYLERPDILGRRRLDAAARLGTFDARDSQISSFRRELEALGVL